MLEGYRCNAEGDTRLNETAVGSVGDSEEVRMHDNLSKYQR